MANKKAAAAAGKKPTQSPEKGSQAPPKSPKKSWNFAPRDPTKGRRKPRTLSKKAGLVLPAIRVYKQLKISSGFQKGGKKGKITKG